mgnify:CR=1 FL=1
MSKNKENSDIVSSIVGASYIGKPKNNTAMFVTKKIENQVLNLASANGCLVFCETGMNIPAEMYEKHHFIETSQPQLEYARFIIEYSEQKDMKDKTLRYTLTDGGYYLGEDVIIGKNAYIQPNCIIGHHVVIGDNAIILSGTKIQESCIGDNFYSNENAVIGANGFTMAKDEQGRVFRVPSLGKVMIGNDVEIGVMTNVSRGSAGDTILCNHVKLDAYTYVAHDVYIEDNVEIPAGAKLGGFVYIESGAFIGINASLRNRIHIGQNAVIGMGAVVTKSVEKDAVMVGNPARPMEKR